MSAFGSKLRRLEGGKVAFWCPGCNEAHALRIEGDGRPKWGFNGNPDAPTFTPSVKVTWDVPPPRERDDPPAECCHSFVRDGRIQFLGDCTHALANQTVDLPDFPA
ncbi:MAG: ammonia monooxygenase [Betaproteobacteria bacterium]|nr:ammonia monooxygenase [Betaproteobacteria bacterium]